ncbi:polysaccharide deacetylase family protein [Flavobacterium subsaxonicum]|nr:hypothetical protein [Flavobacterium subsaxonicum]
MKHFYLMAVLLLTTLSHGQSAKEALLAENSVTVAAQLKLMNYLDYCTMKYVRLNAQQRAQADVGFASYYRDVVALSPYPDMDIPAYLGYAKDYTPTTWLEFVVPVYKKNLENLIALIEKYGYLTTERITKYDNQAGIFAPYYISRNKDYDDVLKKLIKREYKEGNIPQNEYKDVMLVLKRGTIINLSDFKQSTDFGIIRN